ncbi:helix-turn-helix domain-containing protein [Streptomyces hainanensis]|uniref:XRE family transcriptional regulator n=1 Tax=Streptomyces hainanensis TaxID=402648 RepID=A0A4R4TIF1_9ACTN|nr:helix-turn-helix transcriptional regulator [Streptomyces hainanensis]TDC75474.1 XRE family transcriptional regulator [Streptomyces hainanensis]
MRARRQRLAERRKVAGYSQESLAERLGVDRTTIGRWERGDSTPQPHVRRKLATILDITTGELDALLFTPDCVQASKFDWARVKDSGIKHPPERCDVDSGDLEEMIRRDFLRLASITSAFISLPQADPLPIRREDTAGGLELDSLELMNSQLWRAFSLSRRKIALLPTVSAQTTLLVDALQETHTEPTHRRLCSLVGDLFQLSGEIFFDSARYTDASHCYALAASASREAEQYDLWACALTRHAFIDMLDRRFRSAVPLLEAAQRLARHGDGYLSTRHWVAAVQAEAYAGIGDVKSCEEALSTAEEVHSLTGQVHNDGWLRFDGSRLDEERGTCYVELGRLDLAQATLTEVLPRSVSSRRRGGVLTDLAILGAQRGDTEQLLDFAHSALDLVERTSSGYVRRRLERLLPQLTPFMADNRVSDLREQIALLATTQRDGGGSTT